MQVWKTALATALAAAVSVPALAQSGSDAVLNVEQSDQYERYLTDGQGRTLYLFTKDEQGDGDGQAASRCHDQCAEVWPPHSVDGEPQVGEGLDPSLVGTLEREDGTTQLTYGGWPLYRFVKDQAAGEVKGQDVHGFDGEWYLLSPDGTKNDAQ